MISRVKQQLRGSDLHNSAANTPRGRLTFATSKLGLPSANPPFLHLPPSLSLSPLSSQTSRFAPPRNGPVLLFPPALKVIPHRLPAHDLSLRYHPILVNGANDAVEGWRGVASSSSSSSTRELISLFLFPSLPSTSCHEIVSNS